MMVPILSLKLSCFGIFSSLLSVNKPPVSKREKIPQCLQIDPPTIKHLSSTVDQSVEGSKGPICGLNRRIERERPQITKGTKEMSMED